MPLITDIPDRDGLDGAAQLALLRSYLKDLELPYKFPDQFLIDLLVLNDKDVVWADIVGEPVGTDPWSYDPLLPREYINRVRLLSGDLNEGMLLYTDPEILRMLAVVPLRYTIRLIKYSQSVASTYPADLNDPLRIMRDYLEDIDVSTPKYTDKQLADMIINSGNSPYGLVANILDNQIGIDSSSQIQSSGGELASVDGISFTSPMEALSQKKLNKSSVLSAFMSSAYWRENTAAWYVDGVNQYPADWETRWYGL